MWVLLFLLLIKFQIVFKELVTVLIPRMFKFFSMMFVAELLGKIVYLCNELLFKKLLFRIFGGHL